jgi:uncharacterized peroxidase-related enzyme
VRVEPLDRETVPELAPLFTLVEQAMGFVPNSLLTMARWPELVRAFGGLAAVVGAPRRLPPGTKQLVAFVSSRAAGCTYCQAHTSHGAARGGVPVEKIEAAFEFETSPLFDAKERAALRLARDASVSPPCVTDDHFRDLRQHFDDDEIVELVAVISLFGWLNRWNDTLGTPLEAKPLGFAEKHLAPGGWHAGVHEP